MNLDGYIIELIKKIEEQGYEAYIAGTAVLLHCLERSIEEYDIVTSAPLFFLPKKTIKENILEWNLYPKKIRIFFNTSKDDYKKYCHFQVEVLFYHPRHGIVGTSQALKDLEKRHLQSLKKIEAEEAILALWYKYKLDFHLDARLEASLQEGKLAPLSIAFLFPFLKNFLMLEKPSIVFSRYSTFFKASFCLDSWIFAVDYLKIDFRLRFTLFLIYQKNPLLWLKQAKLEEEENKKIIDYLSLFQHIGSFHELKQYNMASLWFPIQRALALAKQDFVQVFSLEREQEDYESFLKKDTTLKITLKQIIEIGFTEQEADQILQFLSKEIMLHHLKNEEKELLAKVYKIYEERKDLDIFF